jgi:ABC-type branched-subunit amino acid transport system ATPase component
MNDDIPALATRDLTISFGGQIAVNAVTCAFRQGTLTAIVGPNGAGKTTYFNLISGQLQPSNGSVSLFGDDITRFGAPQRTRRGLGRAFQLTICTRALVFSRTCAWRCSLSPRSASTFSASPHGTDGCARRRCTGWIASS